jgi:hypothetical protein
MAGSLMTTRVNRSPIEILLVEDSPTDVLIAEEALQYTLAFPISEFGLFSCGFLVSPLRKCFEFKSFAVYKAPVVLQTEDDLFHCQPAFAEDP